MQTNQTRTGIMSRSPPRSLLGSRSPTTPSVTTRRSEREARAAAETERLVKAVLDAALKREVVSALRELQLHYAAINELGKQNALERIISDLTRQPGQVGVNQAKRDLEAVSPEASAIGNAAREALRAARSPSSASRRRGSRSSPEPESGFAADDDSLIFTPGVPARGGRLGIRGRGRGRGRITGPGGGRPTELPVLADIADSMREATTESAREAVAATGIAAEHSADALRRGELAASTGASDVFPSPAPSLAEEGDSDVDAGGGAPSDSDLDAELAAVEGVEAGRGTPGAGIDASGESDLDAELAVVEGVEAGRGVPRDTDVASEASAPAGGAGADSDEDEEGDPLLAVARKERSRRKKRGDDRKDRDEEEKEEKKREEEEEEEDSEPELTLAQAIAANLISEGEADVLKISKQQTCTPDGWAALSEQGKRGAGLAQAVAERNGDYAGTVTACEELIAFRDSVQKYIKACKAAAKKPKKPKAPADKRVVVRKPVQPQTLTEVENQVVLEVAEGVVKLADDAAKPGKAMTMTEIGDWLLNTSDALDVIETAGNRAGDWNGFVEAETRPKVFSNMLLSILGMPFLFYGQDAITRFYQAAKPILVTALNPRFDKEIIAGMSFSDQDPRHGFVGMDAALIQDVVGFFDGTRYNGIVKKLLAETGINALSGQSDWVKSVLTLCLGLGYLGRAVKLAKGVLQSRNPSDEEFAAGSERYVLRGLDEAALQNLEQQVDAALALWPEAALYAATPQGKFLTEDYGIILPESESDAAVQFYFADAVENLGSTLRNDYDRTTGTNKSGKCVGVAQLAVLGVNASGEGEKQAIAEVVRAVENAFSPNPNAGIAASGVHVLMDLAESVQEALEANPDDPNITKEWRLSVFNTLTAVGYQASILAETGLISTGQVKGVPDRLKAQFQGPQRKRLERPVPRGGVPTDGTREIVRVVAPAYTWKQALANAKEFFDTNIAPLPSDFQLALIRDSTKDCKTWLTLLLAASKVTDWTGAPVTSKNLSAAFNVMLKKIQDAAAAAPAEGVAIGGVSSWGGYDDLSSTRSSYMDSLI